MPSEKVRHAWGSRSTSSTLWPSSARAAPSEATVVVLATPPFWLAIARVVVVIGVHHARSDAPAGRHGHSGTNVSVQGRSTPGVARPDAAAATSATPISRSNCSGTVVLQQIGRAECRERGCQYV